MARTGYASAQGPDVTAINLARLLSRLEKIVLSPEGNPNLRSDRFERARVGANVEYARALLLRVEQESSDIKLQSRKQAIQTDLQKKRDLIKLLNQRLQQLDELDESEVETSEDDAESIRDILPNYGPARTASDTIDTENDDHRGLQDAATHLTSTLRSRRAQPTASDESTTSRSALFSSSSSARTRGQNSEDDSTRNSEAIMSHNRAEQEVLTESLLSMAQALKSSSLKFQTSLESEKDILGRASEGLDRNTTGMEAAGRRMGTLKRLTEGKGWLARISMYVWIALLYIVLFAIFALPKIRW